MLILLTLILLIAYLIGALPFGFLVGKWRGIDIRTVGSKNIGATNVFRCVGAKWGILVFLLDMLKGLLGALIPKLIFSSISESDCACCSLDENTLLLFCVLSGTAAMVGHIFPIYLKFKGGKGVSTALGLLFGVAPLAACAGFGMWIIAFLISRYVSLASCIAALVVGTIVWTPIYATHPCWYAILLTILALLAILKHTKNIIRLIHGTENRFAFTAAQRAARDVKKARQEETNV